MRTALISGLFSVLALAPSLALATTIDASLVPDGTYVVKVEKVQDNKHATVLMDNGVETTLTAIGGADFSKLKENVRVKVSVIKGKVPVFAIQ
ncbi:MAG TPA: hypothetical protein VFN49_02300 [Candidatus Aquilonibacter sp.]|nr:hypothetical protein [Candidatus Aquilonibacter sp.]